MIFVSVVFINYVYATETYSFFTKWGTYGTGDEQFNQPVGIAIDSFGNVYVSDLSSHIQKFTNHGAFITKWGSTGSGVLIKSGGKIF